MNELVNVIVQKTGISQENAQKAAQAAVDFIKGKLPPAIAGQMDALLAGELSGTSESVLKGEYNVFKS